MHTVLTDLCTGCELCIPPCPVDCIDLVEDIHPLMSDEQHVQEQNDLRQRYYAHIQREEKRRIDRKGPVVRAEINTELFAEFSAQSQNVPVIEVVEKPNEDGLIQDAKTTIKLAKLRTQIKKLEKQLSVREDTGKRTQLAELMQQLQDLQG